MSGPLRVLLADAAPLQRAGLRAVLVGGRAGSPGAASSTGGRAGSPGAAGSAGGGTGSPGGNRQAGSSGSLDRNGSAGGSGSLGGNGSVGAREIVIAGEAGDGAEAVDLARRLLPDVLISDVSLPRLDGLAVARAVSEARLAVRVLLLTGHDTDEEVLAAITAGAAGYLCKDAPQAELVAAVHAVAAGGAVITPPVLARMLTRLAGTLPTSTGDDAATRLSPLTGREREVLIHLARGRSNSEIAAILGVSDTTVKTHVGHVLTKLRLRDRTQAVVLAYETGLVRPGT